MAKSSTTKPAAADTNAAINVDYVLPEVEKARPGWSLIRDCLDGQDAVKEAGIKYLPMPNPTDQSPENIARYEAYKTRGVFVNMVGRTLGGMVGTAFSKPPIATLPEGLMSLYENIDGGAVSMDQQARQVLSDALSVGRCGLLTDYPTTKGAVTRDKINSGEVRPVIQFYFAEDVINWRYTVTNSLRLLTLLVLRESYEVDGDEFKRDTAVQYRVLRLANGAASTQVYRDGATGLQPISAPVPILQHDGKPFAYIPFEFVGSRNNDGGIDESPMRALSDLNIAHYRNSCDFEQMVFILGSPTTVIAGLSQSWVDEVLKGKVVMGSTSALLLPEGATAEYLQVNESQLALTAMEHKEKLAISIGAKLVNEGAVQRTAKEATMDDASEQSTLLSAVVNVNAAYKRSLESAALFAGIALTEDAGYELNTDFEIMQLDQASLAARVKMWTDGAITFTECRSILRRAGIATLEDEDAKAELEEEAAANLAAMGMEPGAMGPDGKLLPQAGDNANEED